MPNFTLPTSNPTTVIVNDAYNTFILDADVAVGGQGTATYRATLVQEVGQTFWDELVLALPAGAELDYIGGLVQAACDMMSIGIFEGFGWGSGPFENALIIMNEVRIRALRLATA